VLLLLHNGTGALASEATAPATLLLVRHGHVGDNTPGPAARLCGWLDPPLSELGRRQAERLRCRLEAGPRPAALYCSSLRRARETAAPAAGALGLRPRQRRALREISCGHLEGRRVDDVRREHPELWEANLRQSDGRFRWPGGESYRAFRGRVLRALGEIALAHPGERVLVVTHAGVITQALGALAGASPARWGAFRAGNASVTELRWDASGGAVLRFDDRSHLEGSPPVRASR
jgi:alpha-ribazole phosphatase/probable phosphoglycerate mutase